MRSLVLVLAALLAITALAGCTPTPAEGGGQVVFGIWSAAEGIFNVNLYQSRYDADSMGPIFDGMLRTEPDNSLHANVAKEWSISEDGKIFYYTLRDDVKFHDGVKLTAHDVKFTIEWMCHPDYTGVRASNWTTIVGFDEFKAGTADEVTGIKVIDDYNIEFHFTRIDAPAHLRVSTWAISPKHVFEGTPIGELDNHKNIAEPIGSGPFKFVRWVEGQYIEMERYNDYHRGAPILERIIVKTANADVAQAELLTGNTDAAWVQPNARDWQLYNATKGMPLELAIREYPQNGYQYMGLNNRDGYIFSDKLVRQAATYAIDRGSMVEGLLDGMGVLQVSHMSSVSWAYDPEIKPYPYNPEKAKELLEEAGWTVGAGGVRVKDGKKLAFTLSYPTGNVVRMDSAVIIQQNLEAVGFEVTLDIMEFATLSEKVYDNNDFDAYLMGWGLAADPDATVIWHSTANWNAVGFVNTESDRLLEEGTKFVDTADRMPIYQAWQAVLYEECPYVWLYAGKEAYVFNSKLKGFKPTPFSTWYNVELWYWEE